MRAALLLVAAQRPQCARVLALGARRAGDRLAQRCRIEQTEIGALPRERMNHVRRIADQRAARRDVRCAAATLRSGKLSALARERMAPSTRARGRLQAAD